MKSPPLQHQKCADTYWQEVVLDCNKRIEDGRIIEEASRLFYRDRARTKRTSNQMKENLVTIYNDGEIAVQDQN